MTIVALGFDLAKSVFAVHGVSDAGYKVSLLSEIVSVAKALP